MNNKYTVCTHCFTYNHSRYIEDALNGFVMQETTFPVVYCIVDDASTDNASGIIRDFFNRCFSVEDSEIAYQEETDYGTVLYAQHKTNKNCYFAVLLLKENHYSQKKKKEPYLSIWTDSSKYLALCEGDDYWTDPLKLQKQVNVLENNPEYNICSHDFRRFHQDTLSYENDTYYTDFFKTLADSESIEYSLDTYFRGWWTQPLTCLYRNGEYLKKIPSKKYTCYRDDIHYYYVLREGKGILIRDSMGVYRVHSGGVWSGETRLRQSEQTRDNAYSIFQVEGDKRAFDLINRKEASILRLIFNQHKYYSVLKELIFFKHIAPKEHFKSVFRDFGSWLVFKIKRKVKSEKSLTVNNSDSYTV